MTPVNQANPGAMADAALNNVGTILESLSKSPFTWQGIRFRVCGETNSAVQYQLTYTRNTTANVNFERIHVNSLLYRPIHTANLHAGSRGILLNVKIINIIDANNMIVWLDESDNNIDDIVRPVWVRGINTTGRVDFSNCDIVTPLEVTGTIRYKTAAGTSKAIYMLEPTGFKQNVVVGDYFDNNRLLTLAENIWLNPGIDHLQGRQPLPDFYVRQPGMAAPEYFNTLQVGGYSRADGSICPLTVVHSPHPVRVAEPGAPATKARPLPGPYTNTNPMITNSPPAPGF